MANKPHQRGGIGGQEAEFEPTKIADHLEPGDPRPSEGPAGRIGDKGPQGYGQKPPADPLGEQKKRERVIDQRGGVRDPGTPSGEERLQNIPDPHPVD